MIEGLDHVGIAVRNIETALPYFVDVLGLSFVLHEEQAETGVRAAYLDAGPLLIQLVQPTRPGPLLTHIEEHGDGLHHVCFAVPDITAALRRLAPGNDAPVALGRGRRPVCFLPQRPSGLRIELTETAPSTGG
jgi:methylmalonyl-CoA/ethylmalonyl-CoA epimerase